LKVTYPDEAVADILDALTYLNERNPTAAANLHNEIDRCIDHLAAGDFAFGVAAAVRLRRSKLACATVPHLLSTASERALDRAGLSPDASTGHTLETVPAPTNAGFREMLFREDYLDPHVRAAAEPNIARASRDVHHIAGAADHDVLHPMIPQVLVHDGLSSTKRKVAIDLLFDPSSCDRVFLDDTTSALKVISDESVPCGYDRYAHQQNDEAADSGATVLIHLGVNSQ